MKAVYIGTCIMLLCFTGCIFSGSDIKETKLVAPYYITYSGVNYELIVKEKGAATKKVIISSNIDSIGWNDIYIYGKTADQYFIINQAKQSFIGKYNDIYEFAKEKEVLGVQSVMQNTSDL